MAISGGDGSIILTTKVDTKGLNSGLNSMKGAITKIGGLLAAAFSVKTLINFANESKNLYKIQMQNEVKLATVMRQRMKATDDEIKSMLELASAQQQIGIIGDEVQLAGLQQVATFATQKETIETLLPAMNNLIAQQYGYEASTESARNVANLMGKVLQGQVGALTRVGITFSAAEEQMLKTGNEMERAAVLAQVITNNVGEMNSALAQTDVGRQQQLANTFGDIKEQFGAAFNQIAILFLPALKMVANVLATIAQFARAVAQSLANMFGGEIAENTESTQTAISASVGGMENLTDATKEAGKAAKKSLASFDELSIISSGASGGETEEDSAVGGAAGGAVGSGFDFGIQAEADTGKYQEIASTIKSTLASILDAASKALMAVGLIVLFSGNVLGGIGLIMAGGAAYVAGDTLGSDNPLDTLEGHLKTLEKYLVPALLGLGVLLLFLGMIPLGIGLILGGIAYWGYKEVQSEEYDTASFETKLNVIMEAVSLGLVAIGVMLIFFGQIPLGIGLIIAGKKLLDVTEEKLEEGGVTTKIQQFIDDNEAIIVGVGIALLVVALILFAFGIFSPLSLGILVAGAVVLAGVEEMNPGAVKRTIENFFEENAALIVGVSAALIVLGIILLFTGVGIPLAIGLIVAGGALLATEVAFNWNFIVDKVKDVWEKIKEFWNTYIAPIFTAEWWKNLGKTVMNGLIAGFEAGINGIIGMFEKMINWIVDGLNKISVDIPDWVPEFGGKTFGFNLERVKFDRVSIPRLAQGAVIPPNREFLAVLGDQKSGTNIEAPLQTIVDAFNIALSQNGGNYGNTEVVLEIDGREFGRAVVEQGNKENRRIGTRLVIV